MWNETGGVAPRISVIIPALNEEASLPSLLESLAGLPETEFLVADGGSADGTCEMARRIPGVRVMDSPRGRARQMNTAAAASKGEILFFLHADIQLRESAFAAACQALEDPTIVGGNFDIIYEGNDWAARLFSAISRYRARLGIIYGDSGIFCRRTVFEALGGFADWPILEDYDFARRLLKKGKLALLEEPIYVSNRRWRNGGLMPTLWSWLIIQSLYLAGVSPHRLAQLYRHIR